MENQILYIRINALLSAICFAVAFTVDHGQGENNSRYFILAISFFLLMLNLVVDIDYRLSLSRFYTNLKRRYRVISFLCTPLLISFICFFYKDKVTALVPSDYLSILFDGLAISFACIGISIQIGDSHKIQEANCILSLNKAFTESKEFANTYTELEKEYFGSQKSQKGEEKTGTIEEGYTANITRAAISNYLTFFETIYLLYKQENISSIMLNDLFSYRFFLAVHSKTVQNEKLVSQPMNFRNIYYLEKLWMDYRKLKKLPIHNEDNCLEKACSAEIYKEIMKNYERNLKGGE